MQDAQSFLGTGWAFPIDFDERQGLALVSANENVRQSILVILGTRGDRVMRPDFGAKLQDLVFQPINTNTLTLAEHRVKEALVLWEPRIDRISVAVTSDAPHGRLMIEIDYRLRKTNTFYNLVYPFYLMEGEAS